MSKPVELSVIVSVGGFDGVTWREPTVAEVVEWLGNIAIETPKQAMLELVLKHLKPEDGNLEAAAMVYLDADMHGDLRLIESCAQKVVAAWLGVSE